MTLESIRRDFKRLKFSDFVFKVLFTVLSRVIKLEICKAMTLRLEDVDPNSLADNPKYIMRFLNEEEAIAYSNASEPTPELLDEPTIREACAKGDRAYAIIDKNTDTLASWGWYSSGVTKIDSEKKLHFNKGYVYMYAGYTSMDYRGERLHGIGMAKALEGYMKEGYEAIISIVGAVNFNSLNSVYRLGYKDIGVAFAMKMFGRYFICRTPGCRPYGFRIVPIA